MCVCSTVAREWARKINEGCPMKRD